MIQENVNLRPYTTFGIDAFAKYAAVFSNQEDLIALLSEVKNRKMLILGGGSNVLFKANFDGIVLFNRIKGITLVKENNEHLYLRVGAGENWHDFVLYTVKNNWGGVENLSFIPGNVGASPMQNIGAYGVEIKDVFDSLEALEIATNKVRIFSHEDCHFGYRESVFKNELKNKFIILSVTYRLSKNPTIEKSYGAIEGELEKRGILHPTIKDISDVVIAIRQSKLPDPKEIGSGGSFFKNPYVSSEKFEQLKNEFPNVPGYKIDDNTIKVPAGWLIDNAGWKGKTFDNYGVYPEQALVLVNYGRASGKQIYDLSEKIVQDVNHRYGILLEREVNIVG